MPVNINDALPAKAILETENVFVMSRSKAETQDIRPLKILILNLMPLKLVTETQLLRVLSNSPLQVEVELMMTSSHIPKNTPQEHLLAFYKTFDDIKERYFDGMIITGAPVEMLDFEEVDYWKELVKIMDWSKKHVTSTFHICWGAQAALYHHFGIKKYILPEKMFGVFKHKVLLPREPLFRGFDDLFSAPHSRHTYIKEEDILSVKELLLASNSKEAGAYIIVSEDRRQIFVTGHSEYDASTLGDEYLRDLNKGMKIDVPQNYYPLNDPTKRPMVTWRSHAHLLYSNWLNYYVYQSTPYVLGEIN